MLGWAVGVLTRIKAEFEGSSGSGTEVLYCRKDGGEFWPASSSAWFVMSAALRARSTDCLLDRQYRSRLERRLLRPARFEKAIQI